MLQGMAKKVSRVRAQRSNKLLEESHEAVKQHRAGLGAIQEKLNALNANTQSTVAENAEKVKMQASTSLSSLRHTIMQGQMLVRE